MPINRTARVVTPAIINPTHIRKPKAPPLFVIPSVSFETVREVVTFIQTVVLQRLKLIGVDNIEQLEGVFKREKKWVA
jgi:hypothetical protein